MGMPEIKERSREEAITDLIQSVALQEAALAHIMNAEGEKMQKIVALDEAEHEEMMELNVSVTRLLSVITRLEMMLVAKLELFIDDFKMDEIP